MSEAQHLADALEGLFARDHGWFTPFGIAVDGLDATQATSIRLRTTTAFGPW